MKPPMLNHQMRKGRGKRVVWMCVDDFKSKLYDGMGIIYETLADAMEDGFDRDKKGELVRVEIRLAPEPASDSPRGRGKRDR